MDVKWRADHLSAPNLELLGRWDGPADYILGTSTSAHITFLELSGFSRRGNQPNRIWITLHFVSFFFLLGTLGRLLLPVRETDFWCPLSFGHVLKYLSKVPADQDKPKMGKTHKNPGKKKKKNNLKKREEIIFINEMKTTDIFSGRFFFFFNFIGTRPHAIGPPPPSHRVRKLILLLKTRL